METPEILKLTLYGIFLFIALPVIYYVGQRLFSRGRVCLNGLFNNEEMSESINRLLLIGYYLLTFGVFFMDLSVYGNVDTVATLLEKLSVKLGSLFFTLGVVHLFNMFVLMGVRLVVRKYRMNDASLAA
jgi:hypothetical protein